MNEQIWKYIAELSTPGFFVTADIMYEGEEFPVDIKAFIIDKLALIETGISARKFTFHSGGWRILLTFFPTDRVVDERYALKNKMIKWGKYKKKLGCFLNSNGLIIFAIKFSRTNEN